MTAHQRLQCPVCHKTLFEGFWVASVVDVRIHCRCKRILRVCEDYTVHVIQEQQATLAR